MSFEWTSQPLSLQSISSQFTLPVIIRSAPGFRGSNRPILLHSIKRISFAYGRALKTNSSLAENVNSFKPIESEIVAIPLNYPGYFKCLPSRHIKQKVGVEIETRLQNIVERMEREHRSQAFYIAAPLRVYVIEKNADEAPYRVWSELEPHQMIVFDSLINHEYFPMEEDQLCDEDFAFSWWFCVGKQLLPRNEYAVKCILKANRTVFISCSSTDNLQLIPVGQNGSTNVNKLQSIRNLIEQFQLPINIELYRLPGSYAYSEFPGSVQVLGSRTEDFAVCASFNSTNIVVVPTNTPMKFVVATPTSSSEQTKEILSACQIFKRSFNVQIRRILIVLDPQASSYRSRTRNSKGSNLVGKRSGSIDRNSKVEDETVASPVTTDEGYRSNSNVVKRRTMNRTSRSMSLDPRAMNPRSSARASSTDDESVPIHQLYSTKSNKEATTTIPPPVPSKPPNFPYPRVSSIFEGLSNIFDCIDLPSAEGTVLIDSSNELDDVQGLALINCFNTMMDNGSKMFFEFDRDATRSFVNAPSTAITYALTPTINEYNGQHHSPSRSMTRIFSNDRDRLIPVYCDLVIDTVKDYDLFYPIARETRKYYTHSLPNLSKFARLPGQEVFHFPRSNMNHIDELALSIDLPADYEFTCQRLSSTLENFHFNTQLEPIIKNVRFENSTESVPTSNRAPFDRSLDNSKTDQSNENFRVLENRFRSSSIQSQFDRFHPMLTHHCSNCIPTGRSTIHAYVVPTARDLIENSTLVSTTNSQRF